MLLTFLWNFPNLEIRTRGNGESDNVHYHSPSDNLGLELLGLGHCGGGGPLNFIKNITFLFRIRLLRLVNNNSTTYGVKL